MYDFAAKMTEALAWPLVVFLCVVLFRKQLKEVLGKLRPQSLRAGGVQIEFLPDDPKLGLSAVRIETSQQALLAVALLSERQQKSQTAQLTDFDPDQLSTFNPDEARQVLVPLHEASLARLEHKIGLPVNSFQKYPLISSDALEDWITPGYVLAMGYHKRKDVHLVGQLYLDVPLQTSQADLVNFVGAGAAALDKCFGPEQRWSLYVGVISARDDVRDTAAIVEDTRAYFSPAIRTGRIQIELLEFSPAMNQAVTTSIAAVLSQRDSKQATDATH